MNKYQRLIVIVAVIDLLVLLLFPPFRDTPLARSSLPGLAGFFPLFVRFPGQPIYTELLSLALMFVGANALTAWLLLRSPQPHELPEIAVGRGIAIVTAANLALIGLFPPFEPYHTLAREAGASFDSFYFVFGGRSGRPIFGPLLYLEVVFVVINALAITLLFNTVRRSRNLGEEHLLALAETMDPAALAKLTDDMRQRIDAHHLELQLDRLGRAGADRRHADAPPGGDSDRRHGGERRHE